MKLEKQIMGVPFFITEYPLIICRHGRKERTFYGLTKKMFLKFLLQKMYGSYQ